MELQVAGNAGLSYGPHDNLELGRLGIALDGKAGGWGFSGTSSLFTPVVRPTRGRQPPQQREGAVAQRTRAPRPANQTTETGSRVALCTGIRGVSRERRR